MSGPTSPPSSRRIGLIGPLVLITLGVLFLLEELVPYWGLGRTWPALLVVIGVVKLIESSLPPRPPAGPQV